MGLLLASAFFCCLAHLVFISQVFFQEILLEKIMNKVNVKVGMMFLSFTVIFSHQASGRLVVRWGP